MPIGDNPGRRGQLRYDTAMWTAEPEAEWITRAEAGRRLGVSAMAVTKFTRRGMPHRLSDGRVPWPDGLYWSDCYRCARDERERTARESRRSRALAWYEAREAGMDAASVANRAIQIGRAHV